MVENVRKELRRMHVLDNREDIWKANTHGMHYVERDSRYGRWRKDMERNGYRRSDSRRGNWRNGTAPLALRYVRDRKETRFRSQSGLRDRYGSGFRSQSGFRDRHESGLRSQSGAKFGRE